MYRHHVLTREFRSAASSRASSPTRSLSPNGASVANGTLATLCAEPSPSASVPNARPASNSKPRESSVRGTSSGRSENRGERASGLLAAAYAAAKTSPSESGRTLTPRIPSSAPAATAAVAPASASSSTSDSLAARSIDQLFKNLLLPRAGSSTPDSTAKRGRKRSTPQASGSTSGTATPCPALLAAACEAAATVAAAAEKRSGSLTPREGKPAPLIGISTPGRGRGERSRPSAFTPRIGISTPGRSGTQKSGLRSTPAKGGCIGVEVNSARKRAQSASASPVGPRSARAAPATPAGPQVAVGRGSPRRSAPSQISTVHGSPRRSLSPAGPCSERRPPASQASARHSSPRRSSQTTVHNVEKLKLALPEPREVQTQLPSPREAMSVQLPSPRESMSVQLPSPRESRRRSISEQQGLAREQIIFRKAQQDGTESTVRVAVRFRPLTTDEGLEPPAFMVRPGGRIVESSDLTYSFELDRAFAAEVTQAQVYSDVGQAAVQDVLNGYNGTVLAYGQTGSGKTHCMFGPDIDVAGQHGLIPRAARQVFDAIRSCAADDVNFILRCSLLEVYCDQLRDLLDPSNRDLHIQETPQRGVFVDGLTQECVSCEEDVFDILRTGEQMRVVACTKLNELSSRSHVIFILACVQRLPDGSEKVGKLSLADLAGSERVGKSGTLTAGGARLHEATKINTMLSALGHVIQALVKKQTHVPYRNSQLTRVLQETLGGNCKTALVVTCSAAACHSAETLSSLRFATRARLVRNHVKVNLIRSPEQLTRLVAHLQRDLAAARRQASELGVELEVNTAVPWLTAVPEEGNEAGSSSSCGDIATDEDDLETQRVRGTALPSPDLDADSQDCTEAVQEAWKEFSELEEALKVQDGQLRALILHSPPREVAEVFDFLHCCVRVHKVKWRKAALQFHEEVVTQEVAEAEAQLKQLQEEFVVECERRRCQRLLMRRNEAPAPMNASTFMGEMSMLGAEAAADSTDRSVSLHCAAMKHRRRTYLTTAGRRASKVVCPISRRSIERRSVSGTMSPTSPTSSHSATPRASPRGNMSPMADTSDHAVQLGSPDGRHIPAFPQVIPALPISELDSKKLPAQSTYLHTKAVPLASHAIIYPCSNGQATAWSDMVDEEHRAEASEHGVVIGKPFHQSESGFGNDLGSVEERLKREIAQMRTTQERARLEFKEEQRRSEQEFLEGQADTLQHLATLEEGRCSVAQGAIPQLRLELERADTALAEVEAEEDALFLELFRLNYDQEGLQQQLCLVLAAIQQFPEVLHTAASASSVGSSCMSGQVTSSAGGNYDGGVSAVGDKENQPPLKSLALDTKCWPRAGPPRQFAATIQA